MALARHPGTSAGVALGILYLFEAVFDTGLLFAVWPILGGIFAAGLLKWSPANPLTPGTGAKAGAKAGVVGGLILLVAGTPITYSLMQRLDQDPQFFGITFDLPPLLTVIVIFLIYSFAGMLVAAAAGAFTGLLGARRTAPGADHASR